MIEILEEGPKEFIKYCPHCGVKIKYDLSDVKKIFGTDSYIVNCPQCNCLIKHSAIINNEEFK